MSVVSLCEEKKLELKILSKKILYLVFEVQQLKIYYNLKF